MFLTVNSNIQWKMCPVLVWQMNGSWDTTNKLLQLTCLPQFHISNSHTAEQKAGQLAQGVQRHNKLIYALNGERETCFTHTAAELSWLSTLPYAAACCAAEIFQLQTYSPSGLMYFRALSGEAGNAQLWFFIQVGREGNISLGGCCLLFINLIHLLVREGSSAKTSQLQNGAGSDLWGVRAKLRKAITQSPGSAASASSANCGLASGLLFLQKSL